MKDRFRRHRWWIVTMLLTVPVAALATGVTNIFSPGTTISSAAVNQNFQQITDRVTALENANGSSVAVTPEGALIQCGPSDGTWVMIGEYADDDGLYGGYNYGYGGYGGDPYYGCNYDFVTYDYDCGYGYGYGYGYGSDGYGYGYDEEGGGYDEEGGGGPPIDYLGAPPRKVMFQGTGVARLWNRYYSAYVSSNEPNVIAPIDGIGISGAALVSAKVVSDTFRNSGNAKPFSCQRTQIVDLTLNVGGALVKERDTIIMSSIANGSAWNVAEYFTNSAGMTSLTSYEWQSVPPAPAGSGTGL